jgi:hypothetical protein
MYRDTIQQDRRSGWCAAAADATCNYDGPLSCDNCGKSIVDDPEEITAADCYPSLDAAAKAVK